MGAELGYQPQEQASIKNGWETVSIDGEEFKVKRDKKWPVLFDGEPRVWSVDVYEHPATGTKIQIRKLGMDQPMDHPAIIRSDFGCPCMASSNRTVIPGHDCGRQRQLMEDTINELGIGAMAVVDEYTAAGNGHGAHVVYEQADAQYQAMMNGEPIPTMYEYHAEAGNYPLDNRNHELVAKVMAHAIGSERPVIPAGASQTKIDTFRNAGLNVIDGTRVELHTDPHGIHANNLRRDNYHERIDYPESGAYLVAPALQQPLRLTPETYRTYLLPQSLNPAPAALNPRRLPN